MISIWFQTWKKSNDREKREKKFMQMYLSLNNERAETIRSWEIEDSFFVTTRALVFYVNQ
jgi:hypothetical protein